MAKIESYIPFCLQWEVRGFKQSWANLPADECYNHASKGGFAHIADDAGGATMCGVTLQTYTAYCRKKGYPRPTVERLKVLPYVQWREIIKVMFWDKWRADEIKNQSVAMACVDWLWHSGNVSITRIQRILGVAADGIPGPKTIAALNARNPDALFNSINMDRRTYLYGIVARRPSQGKFLQGWLNRVAALKFKG